MMSIVSLNTGFVDWWTLVHFATALTLTFLLRNQRPGRVLLFVLATFTLYELAEISTLGGFGGQETGFNLIGDLIAAIIGFATGRFLSGRS